MRKNRQKMCKKGKLWSKYGQIVGKKDKKSAENVQKSANSSHVARDPSLEIVSRHLRPGRLAFVLMLTDLGIWGI